MRRVSSVVYPMWQLDLVPIDALGHEGKRGRIDVAWLGLELCPLDGAAVEPRRGAGLEAGPRKPEGPELIAKS